MQFSGFNGLPLKSEGEGHAITAMMESLHEK